ncbi:MAG: isocitrate dehydrogenase [bacterium]|nr:isocitrate dehydrogenase [Candidatus Aquidulcis frankliniae]
MTTLRRHAITLIPGDGVGPEVALATKRVLDAAAATAGVAFDWEEADAGAEVFKKGDTSGVPAATRESIERTRVALKGPLETPVGFGEKSANVTLRKLFETYANVRPARELPGVPTRYKGEGIDMVIVRENVEDLYAGIEHLQTHDVAQAVKLISRTGSEKIIRFAYELALREGRHKVTTASKANILKFTEGLFKQVGEDLGKEYSSLEANHLIIDNVAHQMVKDPAQFDVVVATNLHGDIISDLASGLVGGLGFASSANYGDGVAIFEAVHGSAPKYAGPTTVPAAASRPRPVDVKPHARWTSGEAREREVGAARVVGLDLFLQSLMAPAELGAKLSALAVQELTLKMIESKGTVVWPNAAPAFDPTGLFRARFLARADGADLPDETLLALAARVAGVAPWVHLEKLRVWGSEEGFTRAQGE